MKKIYYGLYHTILVDDEEYEKYKNKKLVISDSGNGILYVRLKIEGKWKYLHRLIIEAKSDEIVDHKNGNTLDCQKNNLRICTKSENGMNRGKPSSGELPKGVWKKRRKYQAEITARGIKYRLGSYNTIEEAKNAYDIAALKYHGEFAFASTEKS